MLLTIPVFFFIVSPSQFYSKMTFLSNLQTLCESIQWNRLKDSTLCSWIRHQRRGAHNLLCNDWRVKPETLSSFPKKNLGEKSVLRKHGGVREKKVYRCFLINHKLSNFWTCSAIVHSRLYKSDSVMRYELDLLHSVLFLCMKSLPKAFTTDVHELLYSVS